MKACDDSERKVIVPRTNTCSTNIKLSLVCFDGSGDISKFRDRNTCIDNNLLCLFAARCGLESLENFEKMSGHQ